MGKIKRIQIHKPYILVITEPQFWHSATKRGMLGGIVSLSGQSYNLMLLIFSFPKIINSETINKAEI